MRRLVARGAATLVCAAILAANQPEIAAAQVAQRVDDGPALAPGAVEFETSNDKVRIVISSDRKAVPVVDQFRVIISVEAPPWYLVSFPRIVDEMGPFKVVRQQRAGPFTVTGTSDRIERNERRYLLDPKTPGEQSIPPLVITVLDGSKVPSIACVYLHQCQVDEASSGWVSPTSFMRTKRLPIEVTSVLPPDADFTQPKDILPPVELPPPPPVEFPWRMIIAGVAAALLLAGLVVAAWRVIRLWSRPAPVPMRPAHELALAALRRLEAARADAPDLVDAFYVRLSLIFRRYLDWRFDLPAAERTTDETMAVARDPAAPVSRHRDLLGRFLSRCDRVKFARVSPDGDEPVDMLRTAVRFVEETADAGVKVPAARAGELA